jgi:hypothetical protein
VCVVESCKAKQNIEWEEEEDVLEPCRGAEAKKKATESGQGTSIADGCASYPAPNQKFLTYPISHGAISAQIMQAIKQRCGSGSFQRWAEERDSCADDGANEVARVLSEPGRRWVASAARSLRGRRAGCSICQSSHPSGCPTWLGQRPRVNLLTYLPTYLPIYLPTL